MKKLIYLFFAFALSYLHAAQLPAGFSETRIAENLDPTSMVLASDGRIFITIKSGKILIVENGLLRSDPFLQLEVDNFNERGLGHMVLDPNFQINQYYYVYYTVKGENRNRISRFTANGNFTLPGSEVVLLNLNPLSGTIHNAGAMVFGADGTLFVAVGDGANTATSQSMTSLLGKILRINTDGTIPSDNPFYNSASGDNRAIYALGFRNPYSMAIQPGTGKIYVSEVGGSNFEEINHILAGKNYGWPMIEGYRTSQTPPANYQDPVYAYDHGQGCAVIGAAFYNPTLAQFPASYQGMFFFADYCAGYIKMINPTSGVLAGTFATGISRPLAIAVAQDGSFYYLARAGLGGGSEQDNTSTTNGSLWKVVYTGSGVPTLSSHPASTLIPVSEDASFIVSASGSQPLTYQWQKNGVDINGANAQTFVFTNAQLSDDGSEFRCRVSNSLGSAFSSVAVLSVTSNTRPIPVIHTPNAGSTYRAGESISFSGSASDAEDGTLPISSLTWKIDFHHDDHTHPGLSPFSGLSAGNYEVPKTGETSSNVWYRIYLTAIDSEGLTETTYRDVFPATVEITVQTNPIGLQLNLDGQLVDTPATITSVIGLTRVFEAPFSQTDLENLYTFTNWSESVTGRIYTFDTPAENISLTAMYETIPQGEGTGLAGFYFSNQIKTFSESPSLVRIDPIIDFNWGGGGPEGVGNDNFTIRWLGEILPQFTETYTFYLLADDGIRLWVNDGLIIDKWIDQAATEWSGSIALTEGQLYPILVEYYELGGNSQVRLSWSSSALPKQVVPASQLFSNDLITSINLQKESISVYPTLTRQELFIELGTAQSIHIFNQVGKRIYDSPALSAKHTIAVSNWPSGLYFVWTEMGLTAKFIVQ